jgi:hypothetical protein
MSTLLVTYDLKKPGQDYTDLLKEIKKFNWARLSESSYAVQTELTPQQLYDRLKPYLDSNDTIYVITLNKPYWGWGPKEVNDWLDRYLTNCRVLAC